MLGQTYSLPSQTPQTVTTIWLMVRLFGTCLRWANICQTFSQTYWCVLLIAPPGYRQVVSKKIARKATSTANAEDGPSCHSLRPRFRCVEEAGVSWLGVGVPVAEQGSRRPPWMIVARGTPGVPGRGWWPGHAPRVLRLQGAKSSPQVVSHAPPRLADFTPRPAEQDDLLAISATGHRP